MTKIWVLPIGRIVFTLTEMGKAMERASLVGGTDKEFGFRHFVFCDLGLAIGTNRGLSQNALSFSTESSDRKVCRDAMVTALLGTQAPSTLWCFYPPNRTSIMWCKMES